AFFINGRTDDTIHENPRRMNAVGVESAWRNDLLNLGYCDFRGSRHIGIEIAGGLAEYKIASRIGSPSFYDGEIGSQPCLANIKLAFELFGRFALSNDSAHPRPGIEGWNPGAAGPNTFG